MKMKYFFTLLISFFIGMSFCNAEIQTYDRNKLENYGVNKKWKITSSNINDVMSTYAVDEKDIIYDFADILNENEEVILYNMINNFKKNTNMDLVILTDNFYNTTDKENENFAVNFYDYNDFGLNNEYYSGVIIFRNAHEDYPYYGIYTFGNAQLYYMDERVNSILDNIYYYMTGQNYLNGFTYVIEQLDTYYEIGIPDEANNYYLDKNGILKEKYVPPILLAFTLSFFVTLAIIGYYVSKNKMIHKATFAHDYLEKDSIKYTENRDQFITSRTTSYSTASSSSGGSRSGGGRSGSSGGGHGGGGRRG